MLLLLTGAMIATAQDDTGLPDDYTPPDLTPPELGDFDPERIADIDLADYPILPEVTDHARYLFAQAIDAGRNPAVFSKVGDSMTASESFLVPFAGDDYDLADYDGLQITIDYVLENSADEDGITAFDRTNYATDLGFSTIASLDPTWAGDACEPNETPLACEFRVSDSAIALIMFGTNDVLYFDEILFDYYLRLVVLETIDRNAVPVLYTFPIRPEAPDLTVTFNQIIISIAEDYNLPLINLAVALQDLPDRGVDLDDPLHLTIPEVGNVATFTEDALAYGYTMRNLVTLQALDLLWREFDVISAES